MFSVLHLKTELSKIPSKYVKIHDKILFPSRKITSKKNSPLTLYEITIATILNSIIFNILT